MTANSIISMDSIKRISNIEYLKNSPQKTIRKYRNQNDINSANFIRNKIYRNTHTVFVFQNLDLHTVYICVHVIYICVHDIHTYVICICAHIIHDSYTHIHTCTCISYTYISYTSYITSYNYPYMHVYICARVYSHM